MKRRNLLKNFVSLFLLFMLVMAGSKTALAADNTTKATATPISLNVPVTGSFPDANVDHYYKVTIPNDIGNQHVTVTFTSYTGGFITIFLLDEFDRDTGKIDHVGRNETKMLRTRIEGSATKDSNMKKLSPGSTYYLKLDGWGTNGDFTFIVTTGPSDDSWGTFDKAEAITCNQEKSGIIEYKDDIDCYSITLPNDKANYEFLLSSDLDVYALFADSNGIKIGDTKVRANETNNSFSAIGNGQKIYIRMEGLNDNTNYKIKVVTENTVSEDENTVSENENTVSENEKVVAKKSTISTLKLTKYKKGSKKIVGKTIKSATVKVTVNKKTYKVKSNKKGNFTVKLKSKLKAKQKIKVTVSKTNYKTKTKTFKVKK